MRNFMAAMVKSRLLHGAMPEGFNYCCIEDFVLDRGTVFGSETLTEEETTIVFDAVDSLRKRFRQKECFYNAQLLATWDSSRSLRYAEGYASGRGFLPVHHGWVTLNGKVIDLTWRTDKPNHQGRLRDRIIGVVPDGWEYMGVHFDRKSIVARMMESQEAAAFIGDYRRNFPLFREERRGT